MKAFGESLKDLRIERKMTQGMLAEDICSQSVLSRIENNEEMPNIMVMYQLCDRLGVSIDSVLSHDASFIKQSNELLNQFGKLICSHDYEELDIFIKKNKLESQLFLESDLQRYYYYMGVYSYNVKKDSQRAIELLEMSLEFSYRKSKKMLNRVEILILSCLGRIYVKNNKIEQGLDMLERSYQGLFFLPESRRHLEQATIFYNYADSLVTINEDEKAEDMVNQGIQWEKDRMAYFLIDKFCLLKGTILEKRGNTELATIYYKRAEMIEQMVQLDVFKETIEEREE